MNTDILIIANKDGFGSGGYAVVRTGKDNYVVHNFNGTIERAAWDDEFVFRGESVGYLSPNRDLVIVKSLEDAMTIQKASSYYKEYGAQYTSSHKFCVEVCAAEDLYTVYTYGPYSREEAEVVASELEEKLDSAKFCVFIEKMKTRSEIPE